MKRNQLWKTSLIVLLLAMFAGSLYVTMARATTYNYYGYVYCACCQDPLSGVTVKLYVTKDYQLPWFATDSDDTDGDGRYDVSWSTAPPSGSYQTWIYFSKAGYQTTYLYGEPLSNGQQPNVYMQPS